MKGRRSSGGFVLVFALVLALCAGIILAGTLTGMPLPVTREAVP